MARRSNDDDYLNLGQGNRADEFALGDEIPDEQDISPTPKALFIVPIIIGAVCLSIFIMTVFVFRIWDRSPIPALGTQEARVSDGEANSDSKENTAHPATHNVNSTSSTNSSTTNSNTGGSANTSNTNANSSNSSAAPTTTANSNGSNTANSGSGEGMRPISAILPDLMPSVGMVVCRTPGAISSGSGFIIRADGLFVTNYHVIDQALDIAVKMNNSDQIYNASAVKVDQQKDIAILRLSNGKPETFQVLPLENDIKPSLGDEVIALGYPLGTKLGLELTVSTGIVSSFRNYPEANYIQTNAAINHGNSGGPLIFRRTGRVIGIVSAKARDSESIGFAINIEELKRIISTL